MRNHPGVSRFVIKYVTRRGVRKEYIYYKARIWRFGVMKFLGNYKTAQEADAAYAKEKK